MPQQAAEMSQEEINRIARDATPINASIIAYASSANVAQAGNDAVLTFNRPIHLILPSGELAPFMKMEAVATVYISIKTMKDLYLALKSQVETYESTNGKIVTEYSKQNEK